MYQNFEIGTADDLVKGFAILLRDGETSLDQIESLIMECTDNDSRLTRVVLEKVKIHQDCMQFSVAGLAA